MESKVSSYYDFSKLMLEEPILPENKIGELSYSLSDNGYILSDKTIRGVSKTTTDYKINDIKSISLDKTHEQLTTQLELINSDIHEVSYQLLSDLIDDNTKIGYQNQLNQLYDDKKVVLNQLQLIKINHLNLVDEYVNKIIKDQEEISVIKNILNESKSKMVDGTNGVENENENESYKLILHLLNDIHQCEKSIEICKLVDKCGFIDDSSVPYYTKVELLAKPKLVGLSKPPSSGIKLKANLKTGLPAFVSSSIPPATEVEVKDISKKGLPVFLQVPKPASIKTIATSEPKVPLNQIFAGMKIDQLKMITKDNIEAQLLSQSKDLYKEYNKIYKDNPRANKEGVTYTPTEYAVITLKKYLLSQPSAPEPTVPLPLPLLPKKLTLPKIKQTPQ